MIRNQWYVVLESSDIRAGRTLGVTRLGEKLVFWRDRGGRVICQRNQCPHLGARLSQGQVTGGRLACPFHGFEYDTSGQCVYLPAYGADGAIPKSLRVPGYPTYEDHGLVWIYWGNGQPPADPPGFFTSIDDSYCRASFRQRWPIHYSRMIENQLDVMHLPFVHHNTIGRGKKTVVDGPLVHLKDGLMDIWVSNRVDDGTPPMKAEDIPKPVRHPSLQFRFPNLWHNWISDEMHIAAAFIPIDEENGLFLGLVYQKFIQVPLLRGLANLVLVWSSIVIANQDRRIVTNQRPLRTELKKMGEKLTQGDHAILTYRLQRHELLKMSNPEKVE